MQKKCEWCIGIDIYERYHDEEWGVPIHDDIKHFEFLLLETMQAGLSWLTILRRRENYRKAFVGFDPVKVADFKISNIEELMQDAGIIRNRKKIEAAVNNAERFLEIQKEFGSFDNYIWGFTKNKVVKNSWDELKQLPATSPLSDLVAKDLKKRGFKFVGSTTIYAQLQAIGIINDHLFECFRYNEV